MEDPEKSNTGSLPQVAMHTHAEFQPSDLIVLQHILSEAEPLTALYTTECLDPQALHFVPENSWTQQTVTLQSLQEDYFGRKNNVNRRFEHKLWNALRITSMYPNMVKVVGVMWVTESIIKVYKYPFAKLLNISAVDGGLFHKQGNFTRHGFVVLTDADAKAKVPVEHLHDVDYRDVLLLTHSSGQFTMMSSEGTISSCKWDNPSGTTRIASLRMTPLHEPDQVHL